MPWVENGRSVRCRPDWLPDAGEGILFLDELPQAGLANMNIAATLIREHRIGEHALGPGWMVVCAGNHQRNRAGTTTMPTNLRNRLLHLEVNADANAWARWAMGKGIDPVLIAYNRYRAGDTTIASRRPTTPTRRRAAGFSPARCRRSAWRPHWSTPASPAASGKPRRPIIRAFARW